jgi:hypothetical protein
MNAVKDASHLHEVERRGQHAAFLVLQGIGEHDVVPLP